MLVRPASDMRPNQRFGDLKDSSNTPPNTPWFDDPFLAPVLMIVSEAATLAHIEPFWSWNTPIAWTGFILFADAIVWRARGDSWIRSAPREFVWLAVASIPLWLVFEFYNLFIENWHYVGLPENPLIRYVGYAWSFATIWPAIFEGAELMAVWRERRHNGATRCPSSLRAARRSWRRSRSSLARRCLSGLSSGRRRTLAAPVWLGFIFLLDPINDWLGGESLIRQRERAVGSCQEPGAERLSLRHAVGVLELLVARQVALHRADHGAIQDFRDAAVPELFHRLPGLRASSASGHDIRCSCALVVSRRRSGATTNPAARSRCNLPRPALK